MILTDAQVNHIMESIYSYHSKTASRGSTVTAATETLVDEILEVVSEAKATPGPGECACGALVNGVQCTSRADFVIRGRARCREHKAVV